MKIRLILLSFFLLLMSCENNSDVVYIEENVPEMNLNIINIYAELKTQPRLTRVKVSRTVEESFQRSDTLSYFIDKSGVYSSIEEYPMDEELYVQIALKDIDTHKLQGKINTDYFTINIYSKEGKTFMGSKIKWVNESFEKIWTIQSDSVKIDFPLDFDKIKKEFKSYIMYSPNQRAFVDYTENQLDSLSIIHFIEDIKTAIKYEIRKQIH